MKTLTFFLFMFVYCILLDDINDNVKMPFYFKDTCTLQNYLVK